MNMKYPCPRKFCGVYMYTAENWFDKNHELFVNNKTRLTEVIDTRGKKKIISDYITIINVWI